MIFQGRVTIGLLFTLLLFGSGPNASCGDKRSTVRNTVAANSNASANMNSDNRSSNDTEESVWGGPHVRLSITSNGAEVEFDCAHGEMKGAIKPNQDGRFDLPGTFVREGGPVRSDENASAQSVRYSGVIKGDTMTLTITLTDSKEKLDELTLKRGNQGRLWKCK
jgi:hypothetical protein